MATTSSTTSTSSSTSSSSSTTTIQPNRYNLMPSSKMSAFYRRKNDERVEMRGVPCRVFRAKDGDGKTVDVFGDVTVVGGEVTPIRSWVIVEPYQKEKSRIGDDRATEQKDFPFVGTFRFADDIRRLDLVEIPYEYARAAGLTLNFAGTANNPRQTLYTRFKLVNRITTGINSDLTNKFFMAPTEEVWEFATPEVLDLQFTGGYPTGQTELKAGDRFNVLLTANKKFNLVQVADFEACVGAQFSMTETLTSTVSITVARRGSGVLPGRTVKLRIRTAEGQWGAWYSASSFYPGEDAKGIVTLNDDYPSITMGVVDYPFGQEALKGSESATVNHTVVFPSGVGVVAYSSPNGELSVASPAIYAPAKVVTRLAGSYNVTAANLKVLATKTSNQAAAWETLVVQIAAVACVLQVTTPAARLRSGGNVGTAAQDYAIGITASQMLLAAPTLAAPAGTWQGAGFSGSGVSWSRVLRVHDDDVKGVYSWGVISGVNLAGIITTAITGSSTYLLGGFVLRVFAVAQWPNREAVIGTRISDASKLRCSNLSKGLPGVHNFLYKPVLANELNKFTVTDPSGVFNIAGNLWYNCDLANAVGNTDGSMEIELEEIV